MNELQPKPINEPTEKEQQIKENIDAARKKMQAINQEAKDKNGKIDVKVWNIDAWANAYENLLQEERSLIDEQHPNHNSLQYKQALLNHYSRAMQAFSNKDKGSNLDEQRGKQPGIIDSLKEALKYSPTEELAKKIKRADTDYTVNAKKFYETKAEVEEMQYQKLEEEFKKQLSIEDIDTALDNADTATLQQGLQLYKTKEQSLQSQLDYIFNNDFLVSQSQEDVPVEDANKIIKGLDEIKAKIKKVQKRIDAEIEFKKLEDQFKNPTKPSPKKKINPRNII